MNLHTYIFTLSSSSTANAQTLIATMPEKYKVAPYGTPITEHNGQGDGGSRIAFYGLTAANANALRKWLFRRTRYKTGRGSFARAIFARPKPTPAPVTPEATTT